MMEVKYCKHCQCEHPLTGEWWSFGKRTVCKVHDKERCAKYRNNNSQKRKESCSLYYQKNKERIKHQYLANHESIRRKQSEYYARTPEIREKTVDRSREWKKNNIERDRLLRRLRFSERVVCDVGFVLSRRLRSRLHHAVFGGFVSGSAVRDLGCTAAELKLYIEAKFQPGMSWDNYGIHGWHIDHIIPLSSFDLTDREQFLKACHYTNLQPLWAKDNLKKGCKLEWNVEGVS